MKYYVYYIEDASPLMRCFEKEQDRKDWMYEWLLLNHEHGANCGYEIAFLVEGEMSWSSEYFKPIVSVVPKGI